MKTIKMNAELPLDKDGNPDIATILKANGIEDFDLSEVKVIQTDDEDLISALQGSQR